MPKRPEEGIVYVGCKEAREISLTRAGANPMAHALVRKNLKPTESQSNPEKTAMTDAEKAAAQESAKAVAKAADAILSMGDVEKAHYLALPDDDAKVAFLAKSAADRKAEADAAKKVKDDAAAAEAAKAAGQTEKERETEKSIGDLKAEIDVLKAEKAERDLKDRAASKDFDGYPGGAEKVLEVLKSIAKLPEAEQTPIIESMKTTAKNAKRLSGFSLGSNDSVDVANSKPATAKLKEAAKARATEKKISENEALAQMSQEPEFSELFADALAEDMGAAA